MVTLNRNFFRLHPIKGVSKQKTTVAKSNPKIHLGMSDSKKKRITGFP